MNVLSFRPSDNDDSEDEIMNDIIPEPKKNSNSKAFPTDPVMRKFLILKSFSENMCRGFLG